MINVAASFNELLSDRSMPILGRDMKRRIPNLLLNINAAPSFNQLLRDGSMSSRAAKYSGVAPFLFSH